MAKIEVVLPQMGEGIIEATITRWLIELNEFVEEDEPLVEIATDKVDSEIPAPKSGKLVKCFYSESEVPKVGDVIAIIEDDEPSVIDDEPKSFFKEISDSENSANSAIDKADELVGIGATVKALDDENGISLFIKHFASLRGVGVSELVKITKDNSGAEVSKKDVLDYIKAGRKHKDVEVKEKIVSVKVEAGDKKEEIEYRVRDGEEIVNIDRTRSLIAEHMVRSLKTAPHVTSFVEADITPLVAWRESIKNDYKKARGYSLTYTPIIAEIVVRALKVYPTINASMLSESKYVKKKYINIGIATALPDGNLIVPVVKDADMKNLDSLSEEIADITSRAKRAKLKPSETADGTFTITNLGQTGNISGTPIINQPQSAILAVGAIKKKPGVVEVNGELAVGIRDILTLSLSYDHRIIDGALGGMFLSEISRQLEEFVPPAKI